MGIISRISSGIPGLDKILYGGFPSCGAYLLRGGPGTGKTTLGMHFLSEGIRQGESVLFITLEEPAEQLKKHYGRMGFPVDDMPVLDISPGVEFFAEKQSYDIFSAAEVERDPITSSIIKRIEELKPVRVFLDPVTQLRFLATETYQFWKQILSFIRYLKEKNATIVFTSEAGSDMPDDDLQFLSDGIIELIVDKNDVKNLRIKKLRGSDFISGRHGYRLGASGMQVFPVAHIDVIDKDSKIADFSVISTGIAELDSILGGGIERGTVSLISGPSGVGKTTLGIQLASAWASYGISTAYYSFEEEVEMIAHRASRVGISVDTLSSKHDFILEKIESLSYTAEEFFCKVEQDIKENSIGLVVIDSSRGYSLSVKNGDVITSLHALCKSLQKKGVSVIIMEETADITGTFSATSTNNSYLADIILFIRYFEANAMLRKAIGVLKKRTGDFEKFLREFEITSSGIKIGEPLTSFKGLLSGIAEQQV
ncbi:ATPase domain-containing protein [Spirochaetia bacterium 38H-sp]|uniref:non-specific serine/threonine protein kinase n=1 Tax=Rarispira pelagica TaxID=3141764 RepID=A0ABU9U8F0_9SPIR